MEEIFIDILNMSLSAGWVILAVFLLRLLLKKVPKTIRCCLWILVGIRLVCPLSPESALSLLPSTRPIPQEILYDPNPAIESGITAVNDTINPILSSSLAPNSGDSVNPLQIILHIASLLWIAGILVMLLYASLSCLKLHRRVAASIRLKDNLWLCDNVKSPFIFGVFFPRIYLPSHLKEEQLPHVIAHEKAHLKRHDHWWKPLGFLLLSVYWFNPLCWAAYVMLCRDIELACDERVIKAMKAQEKKDYAETLLSCEVSGHMISACPLAFGEVSVKERIRTVLNYRKPSFWIAAAGIVVCGAAAVCLLTSPLSAPKESFTDQQYLAAQITSMCGSRVNVFAVYESDTLPGKLIVGFHTENGNKPGFAVFNCKDAQNGDECTIKGYHTFPKASINSLTVGEDWGFDHSITIILNRIINLSRLQVQAGSMTQETSPGFTAPSMIVFEWPALLTEEETAGVSLFYDTAEEEQTPENSREEHTDDSSASGTMPLENYADPSLEKAISAAIMEHCASVPAYGSQAPDDSLFRCESHRLLMPPAITTHTVSSASGLSFLTGSPGQTREITVYLMAMYQVYRLSPEGIQEIVNDYFPARLSFTLAGVEDYEPGQMPITSDKVYLLNEFWEPEGSYTGTEREVYENSLRENFSADLAEEAIRSLTSQSDINAHKQACYAQAVAYGNLDTDYIIRELFETILSSASGTSSNPYTYLSACPAEHFALYYYGEYTLNYIHSELQKSSQTDLKEQLMKIIQEELTREAAPE